MRNRKGSSSGEDGGLYTLSRAAYLRVEMPSSRLERHVEPSGQRLDLGQVRSGHNEACGASERYRFGKELAKGIQPAPLVPSWSPAGHEALVGGVTDGKGTCGSAMALGGREVVHEHEAWTCTPQVQSRHSLTGQPATTSVRDCLAAESLALDTAEHPTGCDSWQLGAASRSDGAGRSCRDSSGGARKRHVISRAPSSRLASVCFGKSR